MALLQAGEQRHGVALATRDGAVTMQASPHWFLEGENSAHKVKTEGEGLTSGLFVTPFSVMRLHRASACCPPLSLLARQPCHRWGEEASGQAPG